MKGFDFLWGTWITALVPIEDRPATQSGAVVPAAAQEMVRKALDFHRNNGRERFLKEVSNPQGGFRKGSLYVFAHDLGMTMLALEHQASGLRAAPHAMEGNRGKCLEAGKDRSTNYANGTKGFACFVSFVVEACLYPMKTLIVEADFTSRLLPREFLKSCGPCRIAVNGGETK